MKIKICLSLIVFALQSFICGASPTISLPMHREADETVNVVLHKCRDFSWGYKDKTTGEILIDCQYWWADNFHQGIAKAYWSYWNRKYGLLFLVDGKIIQSEVKYDDILNISEGLVGVKLDNKWGFINNKGEIAIPFIYEDASSFREGLAGVQIIQPFDTVDLTPYKTEFDFRLKRKWGFIDKEGNEIIPFMYDSVSPFSDGLARAKFDNKWGVINIKNEVVIPFIYDGIVIYSSFIRVELDNKMGLIDKQNNIIAPIIYDIIYGRIHKNIVIVKLDGKYGLIDNKTGKEVFPIKYDNIHSFRGGLAVVRLNNKFGFVDKDGNLVVPIIYSWAYDFREGLARVRYDGKWGFVDTTGNLVIPIIYDNVLNDGFDKGRARVKLGDQWISIDKNSNKIE